MSNDYRLSEYAPEYEEEKQSSESEDEDQPHYENVANILRETPLAFPIGTTFDSVEALLQRGREFAEMNNFRTRKQGRQSIVCSRAITSHSRKKDSGKIVINRTGTSLVCNCPWNVTWSMKRKIHPKVEIKSVNAYHNHDCNIGEAAASYQKSGLAEYSSTSKKLSSSTFRDDDTTAAGVVGVERREIQAARKRLAAAKTQASSAAKALKSAKDAEDSARQIAEMAKKNVDAAEQSRVVIESQCEDSAKGVKVAESFLKESMGRWGVVQSSRKKRKKGVVDTTAVERGGTTEVNDTDEGSDEI